MKTTTVVYHSREWDTLVEVGWVTHTVSEPINHEGVEYRLATMVWPVRYAR